ncbi:hypothetical protein CW613_001214 [Vibrio mimicus]
MKIIIPDIDNDKFPYSRTFSMHRRSLSAKGEELFVMIMCALNKKEIIDLIMKDSNFIIRFSSKHLKKHLKVKSGNLFNTLNGQDNSLKSLSIVRDIVNIQSSTNIFDYVSYFRGSLDVRFNNNTIRNHLFFDPTLQRIDKDEYLAFNKIHTRQFFLLINFVRNNELLKLNTLYDCFGLSDEQGNIKLKSYYKNKIFLYRCIRQSINEIEEISDKIFFRYGNDDKLGYTYYRGKNQIQFHFKINSRLPINSNIYEELFATNDNRMTCREIYDIIQQKRWLTKFNGRSEITISDLYKLWNNKEHINGKDLNSDTEFCINLSLVMNYLLQ